MSRGYGDHFKKLKKNQSSTSKVNVPKKKKIIPKAEKKLKMDDSAEQKIRQMLKMRKQNSSKVKSKSNTPWTAMVLSAVGLMITVYAVIDPEAVEQIIDSVEVSYMGRVSAAEGEEKSAETNGKDKAEIATAGEKEGTGDKSEASGVDNKDLNYFSKLRDRKKELDQREKELNELEEELHKQKVEIEARIQKLVEVREQIANTLKERVELDEGKIKRLVDFYSNMKPQKAAKILTKINEDLAVEVLGKMKKKNAADIMNLLEPKKARVLSEKFAGYKRR